MILNYLKIALRNLLRHKFYSIINIFGLAIGITCFLFILIFIQDELSYDSFHQKADRIYRVNFEGVINNTAFEESLAPAPLAQAIVDEFPEVEEGLRMHAFVSSLVSFDELTYQEEKFVFADSNFFQVFSFDLLIGNPASVLAEPNKAVVSRSLAERVYGIENPVGKRIKRQDGSFFEISGVFEDMPDNSHFKYDILASFMTTDESRSPIWFSMNYFTFLVLSKGFDGAALEAKIPDFVKKYMGPQAEEWLGKSWDELEGEGAKIGFYLQPLKDIHLKTPARFHYQMGTNGDIKYVYIFGIIGIFILVIACINFMNLATARSAGRAREVGIRKVLGAYRALLIKQFLAESVVIASLALFLSLIFIPAILPYFNVLANKELELTFLSDGVVIAGMVGVVVFVGFLAGIYPAFYLSAFQPAMVLKGGFRGGRNKSLFRNGLVVFQFATTIALIVGTSVVYKQLNFIQSKKLGYDKEQVILVNEVNLLGDNIQPFREKLKQFPEVRNTTVTGYLPVQSWRSNNAHWPGDQIDTEQMQIVSNWTVDHDYIETMKMEMVAGRNFSREFVTDSSAVILNEAAAELFGWKEPVDQEVTTSAGPDSFKTFKVIGVVKNFHFESLREEIGPLTLYLGEAPGYCVVRLQTEDVAGSLELIEQTWDEMAPGQPFKYEFMDARFATTYDNEKRIGQIIGVFSTLAIFIACLGLFGLAAFTVEQRTKEIGIRKVLGASAGNIVLLLSKTFSKLILIGFGIAVPIAWYFMNDWLLDFKYRTDLGFETFVFAGLLAFLIAWITMSLQSFRAATSNPVDSLKEE